MLDAAYAVLLIVGAFVATIALVAGIRSYKEGQANEHAHKQFVRETFLPDHVAKLEKEMLFTPVKPTEYQLERRVYRQFPQLKTSPIPAFEAWVAERSICAICMKYGCNQVHIIGER